MEVKLQLSVLVLLIHGSLAAFERVAIWKGQTLTLRCSIRNANMNTVEWRNPRGVKMFVDDDRALSDPRYPIVKLTGTESTLTLPNVNFKDGGNYTCSQYSHRHQRHRLQQKTTEVAVLGYPKMSVMKEGGNTFILCSAEGSRQSPRISWKYDDGHQFFINPQVVQKHYKYVSTAILRVKATGGRVTVKCLVQHPSLPSETVMDFVNVGRNSPKSTARSRTTTSSKSHTTRQVDMNPELSSQPPDVSSRSPPSWLDGFQSASPNSIYAAETSTSFLDSTLPVADTNRTGTNTTDQTFVSETTDTIASNVTEERNDTVGRDNNQMRVEEPQKSSLLIFLVMCLILALVAVVIFISVKLRRAHITWKKDNEVSDPSEDGSKSKSSQEEKNSQNMRQKGPYNTAFTQYRVESPSALSTAEVTETEDEKNAQTATPTSTKADVKETEL